jgi:hypothetical protein
MEKIWNMHVFCLFVSYFRKDLDNLIFLWMVVNTKRFVQKLSYGGKRLKFVPVFIAYPYDIS